MELKKPPYSDVRLGGFLLEKINTKVIHDKVLR